MVAKLSDRPVNQEPRCREVAGFFRFREYWQGFTNGGRAAIGLFYTVTGVGQLVASVAAGALWNVLLFSGSAIASFLIGAVCAAAAVPLIASVRVGRPAALPAVR